MDGVLKITRIRLQFSIKIPPGLREKADEALAVFADKCPGYQSIKGCIDCDWDADFEES